jgi:pimeloyl-ACP methyl ester carboxylesterase
MAELQVNGVRLYYEAHGQGPPILCVHGTGAPPSCGAPRSRSWPDGVG